MTQPKTRIDATGKKLSTIITELIAHDNAFARLPRGLVLAWRVVDADRAVFTLTRPGVLPSDDEVAIVRRDAPQAIRITVAPAPVRAEGRDAEGKVVTYRGYQWVLERESAAMEVAL